MALADISHHNLRYEFTAFEVANLIAGDDPDSVQQLATASLKARKIYRIIKEGYVRACLDLHATISDPHPTIPFGISVDPDVLPSRSLWEYLEYSRTAGDFVLADDLLARYPFKDQLFRRDDIKYWLSLGNYSDASFFTRTIDSSEVLNTEISPGANCSKANRLQRETEILPAADCSEVDRLQRENEELRAQVTRLKIENKPLDPRERKSLHMIIAALCHKYKFDLAGHNATSEVTDMTKISGEPLTIDTVRKHLNQAKFFLPGKKI